MHVLQPAVNLLQQDPVSSHTNLLFFIFLNAFITLFEFKFVAVAACDRNYYQKLTDHSYQTILLSGQDSGY